MKLIPFEPGDFFEHLKKYLNNVLGSDGGLISQMTAQIEETEKELIVRWQIPPCDDIQVYVDQQSVSIMGITRQSKDTGETKLTYSGRFQQKLHLPVKVRGERAQTQYRDGVLEIRIEKQ